jgi:hypothetical protein
VRTRFPLALLAFVGLFCIPTRAQSPSSNCSTIVASKTGDTKTTSNGGYNLSETVTYTWSCLKSPGETVYAGPTPLPSTGTGQTRYSPQCSTTAPVAPCTKGGGYVVCNPVFAISVVIPPTSGGSNSFTN